MTTGRLAAAPALMLALAPAALAQQAPAGATACTGCHAPAARAESLKGAIPMLDGRPAAEIEQAMAAFRGGTRPATVMDRIAKGFSEGETRAIAAWFNARK